ncbi:MAG: XRE family transcriptional regulator [Clostridia bacterium]|nr:XRE family transcriptional regulator [Clostridia bacterium]
MNEKLLQIPGRIRELRDILGISALSIAQKIGVPYETYLQYEDGVLDIPISILYEIAAQLGTDMTVLLTGEAPRMDTHCIVRANDGVRVERFPGYDFSSLAFNFINREMEPLLVTIDPENDIAPLVTHGGQEFNYILEGSVRVVLGKNSYLLNAGDSIYFNPHMPHAQRAVGGVAKFLTIIKKEKTVEIES